jgi:hypothetical protein
MIGIEPKGEFFADRHRALNALTELATAYEEKDFNGRFGNFVKSASAGGNRASQRAERIHYFCQALDGHID